MDDKYSFVVFRFSHNVTNAVTYVESHVNTQFLYLSTSLLDFSLLFQFSFSMRVKLLLNILQSL